jgi:hypothetical protein
VDACQDFVFIDYFLAVFAARIINFGVEFLGGYEIAIAFLDDFVFSLY